MQGRISEVTNMKPIQTLGMIAEAAGTRMYEKKEETCIKTIAQKDIKLAEIERVMSEQITPKLEKLKVCCAHTSA